MRRKFTAIPGKGIFAATNNDNVYIYTGGRAPKDVIQVVVEDDVDEIDSFAFKGCTSLKSVTIPGSVTWISVNAFEGCTGLTSVTINNGVHTIGSEAFRGCTSLTSIDIPDSVSSIGSEAFRGCSNLTTVILPERAPDICGNTFLGTKWLANQQKEDPLVVVDGFLINGTTCKGDVTVPNSVRKINSYAFENCINIKSITIPSSVEVIDYRAFDGCTGLVSANILDSVRVIDEHAFDGCTNLTVYTDNEYVISYCEREHIPVISSNGMPTRDEDTDTTEPDSWIDEDDFYNMDPEEFWETYLSRAEWALSDELKIYIEPSIQGGRGSIYIYDESGEGNEPIGVDYQEWIGYEQAIAGESDSEEEFKNTMREYIKELIEDAGWDR